MPDKFRSIKAFKRFEEESRSRRERTLGSPEQGGQAGQEVNVLKVFARVKASTGGVSREELARDLGIPLPALDTALLRLVKEELIAVHEGPAPDDALIVAR